MKKLVESIIVYTSIILVLIGFHQAVQSSVGMDEATPFVRILGSGFEATQQLGGMTEGYPITAIDGTNLAIVDVTDNDFNVTINVCKMIDVDGINSTTADDIAYTEGWTVYLYKDGGLFNQSQQTTGADGCFTWRNLGPGSYMVIEADVDGWMSTGPKSHDFGAVQGNHSYSFTFTSFKLHRLNTTLTLDFPTTTIQLFPVTLKATLKDERGDPVQGVWIRFRFPGGGMGVEAGILTDSDGTATLTPPYDLLFSTIEIMVHFDGTREYAGSRAMSTITVQPIAPYILAVIIVPIAFRILVKKRRPSF